MMKLIILVQGLALANANYDYISDNEIFDYDSSSTHSHNLERQIKKCFENESTMRCLKLAILNSQISAESERRIIKVKEDDTENDDFRLKLPEYVFNGAEISYRSGRGYALDFPETAVEAQEGRKMHRRRKKLLAKLLALKLLLVPALIGITALAMYSGTGVMFPLILVSIAAFIYRDAIMTAVAKYLNPKRPTDDDDDDDHKVNDTDDDSDDEFTTGMPNKSTTNHSRDPTTLAYIAYTPSKPMETTQKPGPQGASITSLPSFSPSSSASVGSTKNSASEVSSSSVGTTKSPPSVVSSIASNTLSSSSPSISAETTQNPSSHGPTLTTAGLISTPK